MKMWSPFLASVIALGLPHALAQDRGLCSVDETWLDYFNPFSSTSPKHKKANQIIHGAAVVNAGIDAALAQAPGTARVPITVVQVGMISLLAANYECNLPLGVILGYVVNQIAATVGVSVAAEMVGWVPGYGNAVKSAVAFAMTEVMGFSAKGLLKCGDASDWELESQVREGRAQILLEAARRFITSEMIECVGKAILAQSPSQAASCLLGVGSEGSEGSNGCPPGQRFYKGGQFMPGGQRAPAGGRCMR